MVNRGKLCSSMIEQQVVLVNKKSSWLEKPEFIIENIELIESECDFGCDLC